MYEKGENMQDKSKIRHAKSFLSIYDLQGMEQSSPKNKEKQRKSVYQQPCGDRSSNPKQTRFITVEQYNVFTNSSYKSFTKSTSTIFYDLDEIAKRHSIHCLHDKKSHKIEKEKSPTRKCKQKSECIVHKCTAKIDYPKRRIRSKGSLHKNAKKLNKRSCASLLSSDLCLRDENRHNRIDFNKKAYRQQKIWSYSKYHADYERHRFDKKQKKKEKPIPVEDPCACQLFTYVCPCSEKKDSSNFSPSCPYPNKVDQKSSAINYTDSKRTTDKTANTDNVSFPNSPIQGFQAFNANQYDQHRSYHQRNAICRRQVVCPNCYEKVSLVSTREDENAPHLYNPISPTTTFQYQNPNNVKKHSESEMCYHDPQCDMIPICQLLNEDQSKYKHRSNPRVMRITKACRHHPPCVVVPSCQRANVLRNNFKYIPPCLHRPHCINLPLCAPYTKSMNHNSKQGSFEKTDLSNPAYIYPQLSPESEINEQYSSTEHTMFSPLIPTTYVVSKEPSAYIQSEIYPKKCCCCRSSKSCQYDCYDCTCDSNLICKASISDTVVFIRDVGCQFKNKNGSIRSSNPENAIGERVSGEQTSLLENNYEGLHTLICEDKFTSPILKETRSSIIRTHSYSETNEGRNSSTSPQVAPMTIAYSRVDPILAPYINPCDDNNLVKKEALTYRVECNNTFPVKSRVSVLNRKYKKMFSSKPRRKSNFSKQLFRYRRRVVE